MDFARNGNWARLWSTAGAMVMALLALGPDWGPISPAAAQDDSRLHFDYTSRQNITVVDPAGTTTGAARFSLETWRLAATWQVDLVPGHWGLLSASTVHHSKIQQNGNPSRRSFLDRLLSLESTLYFAYTGKWDLLVYASPSVEHAFDRSDRRTAFNAVANATFSRQLTPDLEVGLGWYYGHSRGRDLLFPLLKIRWEIDRRLSLTLDLIDGTYLDWSWRPRTSAGLRAAWNTDSLRLDKPLNGAGDRNSATDLLIDSLDLGLYLHHKLRNGLGLTLEAGNTTVINQAWRGSGGWRHQAVGNRTAPAGSYLRATLSLGL